MKDKWQTVEQWEEENGQYPEDGPVWVSVSGYNWGLAEYYKVKILKATKLVPIIGKGRPPKDLEL